MATEQKPHILMVATGHRRSAESDEEDSLCFSDAEDSLHSTHGSKHGGSGSYDESRFSGACDPQTGVDSDSDCCSDVELESGVLEIKVHLAKAEKDCRICHMSLESTNQESGIPIELGCSCKDDLAAAHKHCAEAWFNIRGNMICEICGSTARNLVTPTEPETIELPSETSNAGAAPQAEPSSFWRRHRFLNFLLACMVFAFAISWLFHFNVPS